MGTRSDWREHLQRARNELGLAGLRMHGVLDDDMSVTPDGQNYYWYNVDQVYDYMLELGITPVVELSWMPSALASCKPCHRSFSAGSYVGCACPPSDYGDWYKLVKAMAEHMVERHSIEEVSKWHWEVWNEMWGLNYPHDYLLLYNASATALKAVHPSLKVGGPATMVLQHVESFLQNVTLLGLPLDFISSHHYPSDGCLAEPSVENPDCFVKDLEAASAIVKDHGKPFFITEYSDGLQGGPGFGHGGKHSDTSYAAAFLVRTIPKLAGKVDVLSWWAFSDIFEENWLTGTPFYGGYGLLSPLGVAKPAYRAFQVLADAGTARFPVEVVDPAADYVNTSTVALLATVEPLSGINTLKLFASNFGPEYGANPWPWTPVARNVTVMLPGLAATSGWLSRIDDQTTAPFAAWQKMGSPQYPNRSQLAVLHAASEMSSQQVHVFDGRLSFEMPPYSVVYVRFESDGMDRSYV